MKKQYMREAISLAEKGIKRGDGGPFGALVVLDDRIIGRGWNRVIADCDPTAHAEMIALREAARRMGDVHLSGAVLYASCEPCPMCLSAAYWAHVSRICFAATADDAAAIGFDDRLIYRELLRPQGARRIPDEQLLREQALAMFQVWDAMDDKIRY
jgi:tRNA(Arg) A34 adenosine deaminase TadA